MHLKEVDTPCHLKYAPVQLFIYIEKCKKAIQSFYQTYICNVRTIGYRNTIQKTIH